MGYLFRNIALMIIGVFVVMQFIPAEQTNPEVDKNLDLLQTENIPKDVAKTIKEACYDCHSHETNWPWYSYMAPAKWVVSSNVVHARRELNFSTWQDYDLEKKDHKLEECEEAITEGWMPETSYVSMHKEAELSEEQRTALLNFFKRLRADL